MKCKIEKLWWFLYSKKIELTFKGLFSFSINNLFLGVVVLGDELRCCLLLNLPKAKIIFLKYLTFFFQKRKFGPPLFGLRSHLRNVVIPKHL